MKKLDVIIIIGVIVIASLFFVFNSVKSSKISKNSEGLVAEIYYDSKLYDKISLDEDKEITVKTDIGENVVHVHDHGVEMTKASCPDQVCVATGFINKPGEIIVCLPNKVYVEIKGVEEDMDAVSN